MTDLSIGVNAKSRSTNQSFDKHKLSLIINESWKYHCLHFLCVSHTFTIIVRVNLALHLRDRAGFDWQQIDGSGQEDCRGPLCPQVCLQVRVIVDHLSCARLMVWTGGGLITAGTDYNVSSPPPRFLLSPTIVRLECRCAVVCVLQPSWNLTPVFQQ